MAMEDVNHNDEIGSRVPNPNNREAKVTEKSGQMIKQGIKIMSVCIHPKVAIMWRIPAVDTRSKQLGL